MRIGEIMTTQLPMPVTAPFSKAQRAMLVNLISRAVRSEIMPRFRNLDDSQIQTKAGPSDLVTQADLAAEAMIQRGLQTAFPSAVIIGEEAAETDPEFRQKLNEAELGLIIDPVDGTWNFANGLPVFGTILAATRFGRPVFGLIYDPIGQDFIWTDIETASTWVPRGKRARPLTSSAQTALSKLKGYVDLVFMPEDEKAKASHAALALGEVTTLRCSAHHYRLLAQGSVDFVMANKLNPWDHAAGVLLCQKAGGHAAMLDGTPYTTGIESGYLLCAGNKDMWDALAAHFHELQPEV